jgi:hypothetical protein
LGQVPEGRIRIENVNEKYMPAEENHWRGTNAGKT